MTEFSQKKRVALTTLGCKVNQFESAAFLSSFAERDVEVVPFSQEADVYIVNTCAVTAKAGAQSRQMIRRALRKNPEARLVVTGCYAQIASQDILGIVEQPLCIIGNGFKHNLVDAALSDQHCDLEMLMGDISRRDEICPLEVTSFGDRTRAYLRVQDGCNSFCSYCVVPFTRGRSRSQLPDQVLRQARIFAEEGYRELVVTGIHTGVYGHDLESQTDLVTLLRRLLKECPLRYRVSSLDPGEITDELLELMAAEENLMPHLHIPLQSGDDQILEKMHRRYRGEDFAKLIGRIKKILPAAAIGVDVLAGFPGEDDRAFQNTYDLLAGLPVTYLHVFPYSKRPGTVAAGMSGQVLKKVKDERVAALRELADRKQSEFYEAHLGEIREVLVESGGRRKSAAMKGFTDNYIPVIFAAPITAANQLLKVRLERLGDEGVVGTVVEQESL
ncbi:MAG: tRNA (N(6)-L-threonylcarbamoyladenosine(37)-C(2))-methylthiotransferase MtaB [Thermodesulfobacteriota bacterium]